jgi:hypothetical protein
VYADPCDAGTPDLTGYTISLMGGFLTLTKQQGGKCMVMATITVDPNTPAGDYGVVLLNNTTPRGHATLSITDAAAGPIPPGLAPQVDVLWQVMTFQDCSDAYGKRVASAMYCIQVKIGNNSGYPLQIAGLGFSRKLDALNTIGIPYVTISNNSYTSTRAVMVHEQSVSVRNVAYNILQASGIIMAASVPFFNRQNPKKNFLTLSSIVNGPLLQAYGLILPDPIVRQLGNLDDQSFRDNVVIPNNAHLPPVVVFVEQAAVTPLLEELRMELKNAAAKTQQRGDLTEDQKKLDAGLLGKMDSDASTTARNSKRPLGFKRIFYGKESPLLVKLALGDLVIVGDMIEYRQRIQVLSSSSPGGVAVSISPTNPSVQVSSTVQFKSTVTGTSTTTVTWSVKCAATGSACGAIDQASGLYTAPDTPPTPSTVTVTATSVADTTKSASTTATITPALTLNPTALPDGKVGSNYSQPISAAGGAPPYTFNIASGTLPAGLAFNSTTGVISGTPSAATVGTPTSFKVTATDSSNPSRTGSATLSIKISQ